MRGCNIEENYKYMDTNDYFELKIKVSPEISEIVSEFCFENFECEGIIFAEEEYEDDLTSNLKLISTTEGTLKVYLTSINNVQETLKAQRQIFLNRGLSEDELGSWEIEISKIENQDWLKNWKEKWDVTHITDKITVVPSWLEYSPKENEVVITLDPGSAFGTGTHPTTQLCMRAMEKYLCPNKNQNVMLNSIQHRKSECLRDPESSSGRRECILADIGTGSGILAICGIKLGAKSAYGCDNDASVVDTAIENAKMNGVSDKCIFEFNTADKANKKFDFITANILHYVLAEIMGDLRALMKDNATLVLSGIMDEKKQVVLDAIKEHELTLIEELHQDIWVGLVVKK